MSAFYFNKIENFLKSSTDEIVRTLSGEQTRSIDLNPKQNDSWRLEIDLYKKNLKDLSEFKDSFILIEYPLLRLSKRLDTIIIYNNLIIVIEFKKSVEFSSSDKNQLEDYCINLKYFHEESHEKLIIPILFASDAPNRENKYEVFENIAKTIYANKDTLGIELKKATSFKRDDKFINPVKWNAAEYKPVPTIIEAAELLYAGHNVREIASSKASTKNIIETTEELIKIINSSKQNNKRSICFVTGVPGSGKTLTGLNAVHDQRFKDLKGVYLSGNLPLIKVLIGALKKSYAERNNCTQKEAEVALSSQIQSVNHFLEEYINRSKNPPYEHIVVFDEAQRAWDAEQGKRKFDHQSSEPEMFLQLMERHKDWAVIICLVGNGQEINTGERGLLDWGSALFERASKQDKKWDVYISPEMLTKSQDFTFNKLVEMDKESFLNLIKTPSLHLPISVRSIQSEESVHFINSIIDEKFNEINKDLAKNIPIFVTRSLEKMRSHLKSKVIGNQRCGLISSSDAVKRLRAYGLGVSLFASRGENEFLNYYLDDIKNYKSSNFLETTVNEYTCQGLELDYTGVCWGFDFTWSNKINSWTYRKSRGPSWQNVSNYDVKQFLKNRYRVLLTRFRHGMVIWIPEGSDVDLTRSKTLIDDTYHLLKNLGLREI
jgi:hypothetical protein